MYTPEKTVNTQRGNRIVKVGSAQVKPVLLEKEIFKTQEFTQLSDGFKRIFDNDKKVMKLP